MIRKTFWILFLFCGCAEVSEIEERADMSNKTLDTSVSICYNINSKEHGDICSEECLEAGDQSTFCWTLHRDECLSSREYSWQHENCHFFD